MDVNIFDILHWEFIYIWYYFVIQLRQIFPYWALGMALGSVISVFAKEKIHNAVRALSGRGLGAFGVIPASMLGYTFPKVSKTYSFPKSYVSYRKPRKLDREQRELARERMKKINERN